MSVVIYILYYIDIFLVFLLNALFLNSEKCKQCDYTYSIHIHIYKMFFLISCKYI